MRGTLAESISRSGIESAEWSLADGMGAVLTHGPRASSTRIKASGLLNPFTPTIATPSSSASARS